MRFEAFSEGKSLDHPEANEDSLVIIPGRGFAVIDGVTDISGREIDGMRTGRYASGIVQRAVVEWLCGSAWPEAEPATLIAHVSSALRGAYERIGILDAARADPTRRFGATLTVAVDRGSGFRFILVGDSGLRLNGREAIVIDDGLDRVTATLRQQAYALVAAAGGDLGAQRIVSRLASFYGAATLHPDMRPWLDDASLRALHDRSLMACRARFPKAPVDDIVRLLDRGISGQTWFQNNTRSPFCYSVFDGFEIPMALVGVIERPRDTLSTIELYTDGYFKTADAPSVDAWERGFEEVERIDPEKVGEYLSVKGSSERMRTDDRTVIVAQLQGSSVRA